MLSPGSAEEGIVAGNEVRVEKDHGVVEVTIDREAALNALNDRVLTRLGELFDAIENDPESAAVIITGAGSKAFVAGADVRELLEAGSGRFAYVARAQAILSKVRASTRVVIGAVNGYALGGGCELALACDVRLAAENARFGFPEVTLGVMAGLGGTQLLPRLIGPGKAKYLLCSGKTITAAEACAWGLVEKVYEGARLMEEARVLAGRIAAAGPLAVRASKRAVDGGLDLPVDDAMRFEMEIYRRTTRSEDAFEGLTSFIEKRKPVFRGS